MEELRKYPLWHDVVDQIVQEKDEKGYGTFYSHERLKEMLEIEEPKTIEEFTKNQFAYLNAIDGADLAASIFLSASNYIEIGNTVCNGLKQDMPLEEILSALATSGKENGLNEKQRNDFTLITSAAAVSFLCRDQIEKYKLSQ
jgi:hypothetical protein